METPRKFKGSLFGYKKKDVNAYIMDSARNFEKAKGELEEANKELTSKNSALAEKVATLEKERTYIADALLNAKQEAEKMLAEARLEAAQMRSELELELEALKSKIRFEKSRIYEIRSGAKSALEEYIERLGDIDIKAEDSLDVSDAASETFEEAVETVETAEDDDEDGDDDFEDDNDDSVIYIPEGDDDFDFGIEDIES